jgi:NADPH:quinone reductase-like Zn-dependent oxidoreductase
MSRITLTAIGDLAAHTRLEPGPAPDTAPGADQVLLRMEAAPVNPVDFLFANGWYAVQPQLPSGVGVEGVGRVVTAGSAADRSLVGKRVVVAGTYDQGLWADTVAVAARNVVVVPEGIDAAQLSMAVINPVTAHLMLTRYVDLKPGDWIGQTLGNSAVARGVHALAKRAGVRTLSVVRSQKAAEEATEAGADVVLVDGDDLGDRIAEALGGARLRLVLDGAGGTTAGTLATALEFGGTVLSYSSATGAPPELPLADLVYREIVLRGVLVTNWFRDAPRDEIERTIADIVGLIAGGELSVPIDSRYPLDRYQEALARQGSPERTGKVVLTLGASDSKDA